MTYSRSRWHGEYGVYRPLGHFSSLEFIQTNLTHLLLCFSQQLTIGEKSYSPCGGICVIPNGLPAPILFHPKGFEFETHGSIRMLHNTFLLDADGLKFLDVICDNNYDGLLPELWVWLFHSLRHYFQSSLIERNAWVFWNELDPVIQKNPFLLRYINLKYPRYVEACCKDIPKSIDAIAISLAATEYATNLEIGTNFVHHYGVGPEQVILGILTSTSTYFQRYSLGRYLEHFEGTRERF